MAREFGGFAEPDDSGDIFGAGAETALVMAAVQKLLESRAAADVQSADAFWRVELVSREREQIDAEFFDVNGKLSGGLNGVGVEIDVVLRGDAADFLERLNGAEFVVGVHDGDEAGLRAKGVAERFGIDEAVSADGEIGD